MKRLYLKHKPLGSHVDFYDYEPEIADFAQECVRGFEKTPKFLCPKFLYDKRGSNLFNQICHLKEYYPTRTEIAILKQYAGEIAQAIGSRCELIEYGAGSSQKVRYILDVLDHPLAYLSIDISKEHLFCSAKDLARDYEGLNLVAICADYTQDLQLSDLAEKNRAKRVVFFPGSTIGNFTSEEAREFLQNILQVVGPGGGLLIGVDLKKDPQRLHAAYNDAKGITAKFNLNLLVRMNRELGANFALEHFRHYAFYNPLYGRVEMHLVSLRDQIVTIHGRRFFIKKGESIHTENSHKFRIEEFHRLIREIGFIPVKVWSDEEELFSVHYLTVS